MEKTKPNTTKADNHQPKEMYHNTKINTKKLKPGLVTFYDIQLGNGTGVIISKEKISKGGDKEK